MLDNGSEFLNQVVIPWCRHERIRFTRGRPWRKNDQTYAEQKNWAIVRRLIGYDRYTSRAAHAHLSAVYDVLRPYWNFFQPVRKLVAKTRHGARVSKRYDRAQTPYQRLLASGVLTQAQRHALVVHYQQLNPAALRTELHDRLQRLWRLADRPAARTEDTGLRAVSSVTRL